MTNCVSNYTEAKKQSQKRQYVIPGGVKGDHVNTSAQPLSFYLNSHCKYSEKFARLEASALHECELYPNHVWNCDLYNS